MGKTKGYIITSLSSSIKQRTFKKNAKAAPYVLGTLGPQSLRGTCQPYTSFPADGKPNWDRSDCGVADTSLKMPAIDGTTPIYTPELYRTEWYTEIVDAVVTGTVSTHVGSFYINYDTIPEITILASDNGAHFDYVSTQIRRFTDNSLLTEFEITSATTSSVTNTNVSVPARDWYDIYLSASTTPGTASLEGIFIEYKI
jgi:hypothetical protein